MEKLEIDGYVTGKTIRELRKKKKLTQKEQLYYIDYECNTYMEEWNFENWGIQYWSKTQAFLDYVKQQSSKGDI